MKKTDSLPGFHLLAKPIGAACNLGCKYCFFLSKKNLYPGSSFRMSDELLETYIRQYLEAQRIPQATVALLILGQAAGVMSIPVVSSGEIPNLSNLGKFNQSADMNGTINLQGPTPNVVHLSGYFVHMYDFSNLFYVLSENRGFTTTVSSGGSGGGDGGGSGGM